MRTKKKEKSEETVTSTSEQYAQKIFEAVKAGKIEFEEFNKDESETLIEKSCDSKVLPSGGIISLLYKHKKGINDNGKQFNPSYNAFIKINDKTQQLRGKSVRFIFDRVMKNKGMELTKESIEMCDTALEGL